MRDRPEAVAEGLDQSEGIYMQPIERKPETRGRLLWVASLGMALALAPVGCSHTESGLAAGGVGGALVGGLVGNALGNTGAGAVVGAATGAIAGGAIGSSADRAEARADARAYATQQQAIQSARGPLGLEEVVRMAQSNVGDDVIIEQIRLTNAFYTLNAEQLIWLKQQGVSDRVIRAMQTSGTQPAVRYVTPLPPPPATTVIYERPVYVRPCPPPPVVGFGVRFRR
jgi:hypothetical protein